MAAKRRKPRKNNTPRKTTDEIRSEIIAKVIAALEGGSVPWRKPWRGGAVAGNALPMNLVSKKRYRGSNVWNLAAEQMINDYSTNVWASYKQITEAGGQVRRGETHTKVVKWNFKERVVENAAGEEEKRRSAWPTFFQVFNLDQADWPKGLPKWVAKELEPTEPGTEHDEDEFALAEDVLQGYFHREAPLLKVEIKYSAKAAYSPTTDTIVLPEKNQFDSLGEFYSTAFHEAAHSTGGINRLKREGVVGFDYHGSHQYSREELVAEMSAAMLCGLTEVDLTSATLDNSVAYIAGWAKALRSDPDLLFKAASEAEKAVALIAPQMAMTDDEEEPEGDLLAEEQAWREQGQVVVVDRVNLLEELRSKLTG